MNNIYKNRELSWLEFEDRILNEAIDHDNLLFERLKFLSITSSNLDEFIMVRVAALVDAVKSGLEICDIAGMTPTKQLEKVYSSIEELRKKQYDTLYSSVISELMNVGVDIRESYSSCSDSEKEKLDKIFDEQIFPILTPITVDEKRPFPLMKNKALYVCGFVKRKNYSETLFAMVEVPKAAKRLIEFETDDGKKAFIFLEELIIRRFNQIFSTDAFGDLGVIRVIRNGDLYIEEADMSDPLGIMEKKVEKRELGNVICMESLKNSPDNLIDYLCAKFELSREKTAIIEGPLDLTFLMDIYGLEGFDRYKRETYTPVYPKEFLEEGNFFKKISAKDYMLVHPFESFLPVIDFLNEAAEDENVVAIKQTIYRVSEDSPIIKALIKAAENGKQVTVLMELKARFDEENNIYFARKLEKAGCQVIYGFANLKTHCKITLVVRREGSKLLRYVHLGTGNYNDTTAKLYTDIGFFTSNDSFGNDAIKVFNMLSGLYDQEEFEKLSLAPMNLRKRFIELIEREKRCAEEGKPAHIVAKLNSLCDKEIIDALYLASKKGVKIDLIVRGICSLRAGVEGISENITVRSIVGNFLEHSRIYYFKNGGDSEFYCSSADWMERNMDRRIEILFPVEADELAGKLRHVLTLMLKDNRKAWFLQPDGTYRKMPDASYLYSFQDGFCEEEKEQEMRK